jgi:hypothetical protein
MTEVVDAVEEIRRIRDAQAAEFNYDAAAIGRHVQELERTSGRTYLSKRPDGTECWMRYGQEVDGPTDQEQRLAIIPDRDIDISSIDKSEIAKIRTKLAAQRAARESAA